MILLIDANNLAFRADQTSDLTTKSGKRVGAIYGTLRMIKSYLTQTDSKHRNDILESVWENEFVKTDEPYFRKAICAWDGGKSAFRKKLYPDYKGQRERRRVAQSDEEKNKYESFVEQMKVIDEMLPNFGVHSIKVRHYEADDIIYYISTSIKEPAVIVSTDKDMLQLVNSHIAVWSPYKKILYTKANFKEKTGISKSSFIDYRVLIGDSSDNIKGVKGIGEKTARQLIGQYKNIDNIFSDRQHLIKKVRTARIFDEADKIDLNKQLMDMNNIPIDESFKEEVKNKYFDTIGFESKFVKKVFMKYRFTSLLSDFIEWSRPFRGLEE